jgi:hypothetical protein
MRRSATRNEHSDRFLCCHILYLEMHAEGMTAIWNKILNESISKRISIVGFEFVVRGVILVNIQDQNRYWGSHASVKWYR